MAEQYPLNAAEAFLGTAGCWFDIDALARYAEKARDPEFRVRLRRLRERGEGDRRTRAATGMIRVWEPPEKEQGLRPLHDVATGRGNDYSSPTVIDLTNMNICASCTGRLDPDLIAEQLHFLGRWYNTARLAVEMGGGYGEPIIISPPRRQAGAQALPEAVPPRPGRPPRLPPEHHLRLPDHDEDPAADHQPAGAGDPRGERSRTSRWRRSWSARPSSAATRCPPREQPRGATTTG